MVPHPAPKCFVLTLSWWSAPLKHEWSEGGLHVSGKEDGIRRSSSGAHSASFRAQNWMSSLTFTEAELKQLTQEDSAPEQWHWSHWQPKGCFGNVYLHLYLQLTASLTIPLLRPLSTSCLQHNLEFFSPIWDPCRAAGCVMLSNITLPHLAAWLFWCSQARAVPRLLLPGQGSRVLAQLS